MSYHSDGQTLPYQLRHATRPWWPKTTTEVDSLMQSGADTKGRRSFVFLILAAAGAEWDLFLKGMERVCGLSSSEAENLLLDVGVNMPWSSAYASGGLPPSLFHLFIKAVQIGRRIAQQSPQIRPSHQLRVMVLEKALAAVGEREIAECSGLRSELLLK